MQRTGYLPLKVEMVSRSELGRTKQYGYCSGRERISYHGGKEPSIKTCWEDTIGDANDVGHDMEGD